MEKKKEKWQDPISIVIPAYNEARRILSSLKALDAFCEDRFQRYEIICVDDGSTDETWDLISNLDDMSCLKSLRLTRNQGKGYATRQGIAQADGRFVFFTDADLPYHLDALDKAMTAFYQNKCDVVSGARDLSEGPDGIDVGSARGFASRAFSNLVARLFNLEVHDTQCGFKGFTEKAAAQIFTPLRLNGYAFDVEIFILARSLGLTVCKIPVTLVKQAGSKIRLTRDPFVMLKDLVLLAIRERRLKDKG